MRQLSSIDRLGSRMVCHLLEEKNVLIIAEMLEQPGALVGVEDVIVVAKKATYSGCSY